MRPKSLPVHLFDGEHRIIDIGCGSRKYPGSLGIDVVPGPGVDLVADLGAEVWPLDPESVDLVIATHVLEHLDLISTMTRIHECLKPGGYAWIRVPHWSARDFWKDPTHRRPFHTGTFDYWQPGYSPDYGFDRKYEIVHKALHLYGYLEVHSFRSTTRWIAEPLRRLIDAAANSSHFLCERFWAPAVGGFCEVEFVLRKP
ncbi:MAG: class I SAM-dependent methyltransferase [Fibrobacteria bacterium]|nr:class I SAM-dependent methyltransferase [Fibrobacteria bacterium]